MNHSFHDIAVLEEFHTFDAFPGDDDFFPGFGMEEMVTHFIFIRVLVRATFDAHFVDLHAGVPGLVEDTACLDVAQFGTHESRAFSGLYMKEFNDKEIVAVDIEAHTVLKISCCCHKKF